MPDIWMDVDTAVIVPVNFMQLIDDTTFKDIEIAIVYNSAGLVITWNFVTTAGVQTGVAITPTTGDDHDWSEPLADKGMYAIEIPASGGDANNDTEGFGWITGVADGVLPWRGPLIGFRAAALNNLLIDVALSATRGLAGTALPDAVADAAGGLPISDAGGLDLDTKLANTNEVTAARMGALTDWIDAGRLDAILDIIAADVVNIDGDAMRGTDSAGTATNLATVDTVVDGIQTDLSNATDGLGALKTLIDAAKAVVDAIETDTQDIQSRIPAALESGRMKSYVGAMAAGVITATVIADGAIDDATLAADMDRYQAVLTMVLDSAGTTNRYGVDFYENGEPLDTGITVPKIQVIKCSDASDLVALVALVEVGSIGRYKYVESSDVITAGQLYKVYIEATIGGSTRVWHFHMWRDA